MRSKNAIIILIFLIAVFVLVDFVYSKFTYINDKDVEKGAEIKDYNISCITKKSIKEVRNDSMEPMIKPGEEFELLEGYYNCNKIERGDVVAYDYKGNEVPIIKKIMVIGGDEVEFKENKLLVNNEILKNSIGEEYIFSEKNQKMINLYIKDGKLRDDAYFIFGDNVQNSLDSKSFGAVGKNGLLGKFLLN